MTTHLESRNRSVSRALRAARKARLDSESWAVLSMVLEPIVRTGRCEVGGLDLDDTPTYERYCSRLAEDAGFRGKGAAAGRARETLDLLREEGIIVYEAGRGPTSAGAWVLGTALSDS